MRFDVLKLGIYERLSRIGFLSYRAKIMLMAFLGTHLPLIAVALYLAFVATSEWSALFAVGALVLAATLVGTTITLFMIDQLLRPVLLTSRALRNYRESRIVSVLPTHHRDEAGSLMADASSTIRHLEDALDRLEHTDTETGLPNRKRFIEGLRLAMVRDEHFALVVARVDSYDPVAESRGRAAADSLCRNFGLRLADALQGACQPARTGDCEFAFTLPLAPGISDPAASVAEQADALLARCSSEIVIGSISVLPQMRGGLAIHPDDDTRPDVLLEHASAAAKAARSGTVLLHSPAIRHAVASRFELEQDLRRAVERNQLELHYQPVIDINKQRPVSAEALLRWRRDDGRAISPAAFVPVAEATGLIDTIGAWAMQEACGQLAHWHGAGHGDMRVAVNLSLSQFTDAGLRSQVEEALISSGVRPDRLELELTETVALVDAERVRGVLAMLRGLGISIALDDFGTGYASLSHLRRLAVDTLKIDREFVRHVATDRDARLICDALISLGSGLGLRVIAEGVETPEELDHLVRQGCRLFQGNLFSPAVSPDAFQALLEDFRMPDLGAVPARAVV